MRKVFVLFLVGLIALFVFSSVSIVSAETGCELFQIRPTPVNCQDCCDWMCAIVSPLPGGCNAWCYCYCDAMLLLPCVDGVIPVGHSQCSPNKPKYCENSKLIDKCQVCGCPSGKDCCSAGTPGGKGKCFTPEDQEAGCCEYGSGKCFDGTMDPALCKVCSQGKWHSGKVCCKTGPNKDKKCYTPGTPEDGCCKYSGGCYSSEHDPEECVVCYGGTWYPGKKCCDGNCYECCTDADCQDGYICNLETHKCEEEVPEFPAGVTVIFGACMLMFFMMRRKYIEK